MSHYRKYPRTYHMPWSPGVQNDDRVMKDTDGFGGREVVVSIKMDGENTSMYQDHYHARSIDSANHPSRNYVKGVWGSIRHQIPEGWRICGENVFAKHSIAYNDLPNYFMGFSIWNEQNICLSWPKTLAWFTALDICPVETIYTGVYNSEVIRLLGDERMEEGAEGYVIRPVDCFSYQDFGTKVGKVVRKNHVQTDKFWRTQEIIPNGLRKD